MTRAPSLAGLGLQLALTACGPSIALEDSTNGATGDPPAPTTQMPQGSTTGMPDPPPATSTTTSDPDGGSEDPSSDDGMVFLTPSDVPPSFECDFFEQDCPPGDKCIPVALDGGTAWNALRCRPVADAPAGPGEPCMGGDGPDGFIDDCDADSMCLFPDEATGQSYCYPFCTGSVDSPWCEEPGATCVITSDPFGFCYPPCDPLAQDCPEGQACYPYVDGFICAPDASGRGGSPGMPCEFVNGCDPGSICAAAEYVPDCMDVGCCTSFCDITDPAPPCLPGQSCQPWDDAMPMANPGICAAVP